MLILLAQLNFTLIILNSTYVNFKSTVTYTANPPPKPPHNLPKVKHHLFPKKTHLISFIKTEAKTRLFPRLQNSAKIAVVVPCPVAQSPVANKKRKHSIY